MASEIPAHLIWAVISAGVVMTAYAFSTFETKEAAHQTKRDLEKKIDGEREATSSRLERIENKMDKVLDRILNKGE